MICKTDKGFKTFTFPRHPESFDYMQSMAYKHPPNCMSVSSFTDYNTYRRFSGAGPDSILLLMTGVVDCLKKKFSPIR